MAGPTGSQRFGPEIKPLSSFEAIPQLFLEGEDRVLDPKQVSNELSSLVEGLRVFIVDFIDTRKAQVRCHEAMDAVSRQAVLFDFR